MDVEGAATALIPGHLHLDPVPGKDSYGGLHRGSVGHGHDAAGEERDSRPWQAGGADDPSTGGEEAAPHVGQAGLHVVEVAREGFQDARGTDCVLKPASLVEAEGMAGGSEALGVWKDGAVPGLACQAFARGAFELLFDLGAGRLHERAVRHLRRAHLLAGAALEAQVPVAHHGVGNPEPAFVDCLHQREAAAG